MHEKHTTRVKKLSSAEEKAEELAKIWHYKTNRSMLWKSRKKNPGDIQKTFYKTRRKLTVDQSQKFESRPNISGNNVIMETHPETQQEEISRIFWYLCKNWNIDLSLNQGGTNSTSIKQIGKDLHHTILLHRNGNRSMYWESLTGNCNDIHDEVIDNTSKNYIFLKLNIKQKSAADAPSAIDLVQHKNFRKWRQDKDQQRRF